MSAICVTCLSTERHLIQIQNLYTDNWQDVSLQMTDYICWECEAMFNNIWRFKQQVLTAQDVLRNQDLTEIPKVIQCLSKLTKSIKTSYDSEYHEDDVIKTEPPSVDYLDETVLHEEVDFTNDCFDTKSIKTEIEDPILNNSNEEDDISNVTEQPNDSGPETQLKHNSKVTPFTYIPSTKEKMFNINVMNRVEFLKARESDRELPRYKLCPYKCEECILGYFNEKQYKKHLNIRHAALNISFKQGQRKWFCNTCNIYFTKYSAYKVHTIRHYLSYQCKVCEFKSHRINEMTAHHSKEHDGPKACNICNAQFSTAQRLDRHRNKKHNERTRCTICLKQFTTISSFKSHLLIHEGLQPTGYCEICKKHYKYIKKHMYNHRSRKPNISNDENAFCAECNVQYKSLATYKAHLKETSKHVARDEFPYICAECGRKFINKNSLVYHLNAVHYNKKKFVCHICNKAFVRSDRLKDHIAYIHEGVSKPKNFICSYCSKGFASRPELVNHVRTHTGEKPFECELCDARFRQKSTLSTHVKGVHKKSDH